MARTTGIPLLGTCGGFQHLVLEYARNVLGMVDADHAEYEPDAPRLFVDALECSLAGLAMAVTLRPGTVAAVAYEASSATERYYCNFGLNPRYRDELEAAGLRVSGTDQDGAVRIVELSEAGFFVGTLFVPQVSSTPDASHPLVRSFVAAAEARYRPRDPLASGRS